MDTENVDLSKLTLKFQNHAGLNETDKKDMANEETSPEEDIESKQENADETAAVSEEE